MWLTVITLKYIITKLSRPSYGARPAFWKTFYSDESSGVLASSPQSYFSLTETADNVNAKVSC